MMNRTTLITFLAVGLLTAACSKKDAGTKSESKDDTSAAAKPTESAPAAAEPAPAAAAPVKTDAKTLFAEFGPNSGIDGMTLLDKYHEGATFTGKVKNVGPSSVIFDVDGKNTIVADFTDAAAMKAKAPKAGDELTVTCKIGGEVDAMMQVMDCALAK